MGWNFVDIDMGTSMWWILFMGHLCDEWEWKSHQQQWGNQSIAFNLENSKRSPWIKCDGISNVGGHHRIGKMFVTFLLIMFCLFLIMATLIMQIYMPRPVAFQLNHL